MCKGIVLRLFSLSHDTYTQLGSKSRPVPVECQWTKLIFDEISLKDNSIKLVINLIAHMPYEWSTYKLVLNLIPQKLNREDGMSLGESGNRALIGYCRVFTTCCYYDLLWFHYHGIIFYFMNKSNVIQKF